MTSPLPNLSQVYNILLQKESQREIHSGGHFLFDSASLAANSRFPPSTQYAGQFPKKFGTDPKKSTLHCNYCKKPGHSIEKCYKLHGFPADFKFTKPKRFANSVTSTQDSGNVNNSAGMSIQNNNSVPNSTNPVFPGLSPDLCSQLVNLLKSTHTYESVTQSAANFVGN